MDEQQKIRQIEQIDKLLARFKSPAVAPQIKESLSHIIEISNNPTGFIPEAVSSATHDLTLLEMIEDGIELLIKVGNNL